jgi:hypothetical protein
MTGPREGGGPAAEAEVKDGRVQCMGDCDRWLPADRKFFEPDPTAPGGLCEECRQCRGGTFLDGADPGNTDEPGGEPDPRPAATEQPKGGEMGEEKCSKCGKVAELKWNTCQECRDKAKAKRDGKAAPKPKTKATRKPKPAAPQKPDDAFGAKLQEIQELRGQMAELKEELREKVAELGELALEED